MDLMRKMIVFSSMFYFLMNSISAQVGSGNAISISGNDQVEISSSNAYFYPFGSTVEFWFKIDNDYNSSNDGNGRVEIMTKFPYSFNPNPSFSYGFQLSYLTGHPQNAGYGHRILYERYGFQGIAGPVTVISDFPVNDNKYHHVFLRYNDMYIDGIQQNTSPNGLTIRNITSGDFLPIYLGKYFTPGLNPTTFYIDELRIWNRHLNEIEIRERMCRKIGASDPLSSYLVSYYKFDEVSGSQIVNNGSLGINGTISNTVGRHLSAAPIGDTSVYVYSNAQIPVNSLTLNGQDQLSVSYSNAVFLAGSGGSHIYGINEKPNTESGITEPGTNNRYFGVYNAGISSSSYAATYQYSGNPFVTVINEGGLRLFKRSNNSSVSWINSGVLPDMVSNNLQVNENSDAEFVLGNFLYQNDEPCSASIITPGLPGVTSCQNPVTGNVAQASFNNLVTCAPNTPDVWYQFTATATSHVVKIDGDGTFQPAFAIFAASNCADVANPPLLCVPSPGGSMPQTSLGGVSGLTIGATYYIKVSNAYTAPSSTTTFSICVLTPVHDEPCMAGDLPIPVLPGETSCSNPVNGNMLLATGNGLSVSCSGSSVAQPDLWYRFVAAHSNYLVRLEGADIDYFSLFTSNTCNDLNGAVIPCRILYGNTIIPLKNLTIGATYYIRLNGPVDANFPGFSICLLLPPANNEPCGAVNLTSAAPGSSVCSNQVSGNGAYAANSGVAGIPGDVLWYQFTATQTSHFLKMNGVDQAVLFSAPSCGAPMTQLQSGGASCLSDFDQFSMKNLVVGTTYYLAVEGGSFDICLLSVDNDEPCTATALGNCSTITGDLALATNTLNPFCDLETPYVANGCGFPFPIGSIQPKDLWYTFTATSDFASFVFNRVGSGPMAHMKLNIQLSTFTDCQNPTVSCPTGSSTLNVGTPLIRTFATVIGQAYYLRLSNAEYNIPEGGGGFSMELRMGNSSVSVTKDPSGPVCSGSTVTFTATPDNGGFNPQYTWRVNSTTMGTGPTFSSASLQDNDVVTCLMTSSNCVAPPTVSSSVTMDVYPIPTWYQDADGDGFGSPTSASTTTCDQPAGYVLSNTDCDDANASVYPGSVNPRPFRTRQNGNWGSSLTWESFDGCNWVAGGIPSATDSTITINHEITIPGGTTRNANQVVIQNGRLTINGTLNLVDAAGDELVNNSGREITINSGGILSGEGTVLNHGSLVWPAGTISGVNLVINNMGTAHLGAGQTSIGALAATLVNNGTVNFATGYGGCCVEIVFTMTNGTIENNGQFIFQPTGGGGVRHQTLSGGTFNNNAGGTLINNATAVSQWGDNETYLRNTVFTNNGTILANGVSLNIFPTTNPVIGGTITVAAGSQVKFGIPSTTTTFASNAVINGAGRVYFFDGDHQVNTPFYTIGSTYIGQIYSAANVNFNASNVALDYLFIYSGVLGGPATKLLKDDMVFIYGQLTGGSIENTDTSVCYFGAGNPGLGAINTAFTNNGVVEVNPYYGGCCTEPVINMSGGSFTNNGTFNVSGGGGIRYVGLSNGTFINNAGGVINSNVGDVSFGEPSFRMQPSSFTNLGTINVLRNIMELGAFTVGGVINVSPGTLLRSTGTVTFNGSLINNNGNITAPFNFINASAKTLKGNGTFSSDVALNNAATVAPGSSPGILTVAGNYTQGAAALDIEIGGTTPGTGHDRLVVTGTAAISGTLNATEINGFDPQSFTSIDILTASSVTGTFSQVNLPPLWSVQYAANKVSLVKYLEFVYYRDQDGDGFGNVADTIRRFVTTAPTGYTTDSTDCNDNNAAVNPAATEICNGIDDNCDGIVDSLAMPGLILYMSMNGTANDLSGNGLNGTIFGSVTATTDRFGNPNSAMEFPGNTSSYIRVNDQPLLRPSSITLSAWVRMGSQPGLTGFVNKSINCYNDSWHFGSQGGNYSTWVSNSTNCGDFVQMTSPNSVGNWRHVVFTLDDVADTRRMYVDGNLVASGSYTSSIPYDGNPVLIGAAIENGNLDFPFHGSLDDVMIFNRAITATEVNTLFTQGSPLQALNTRYYADADGDGFGDPALSQLACSQPVGYVLNNTDCNDNSAAVYPGATEVCDGLDNDCDGQIDLIINNTGLVAYYPFSGNANDARGSLNGTVNGATLTTDRFGNANSAYGFDGVDDFIGLNGAFNGYNELTISAWYKVTAASPDLQAIISSDQSGKFVHIQTSSAGISNCAVYYDNNNALLLNIPTASLNQWVHLALVAKSGNSKLYINGVEYSSSNATFSFISSSNLLRIGSGYLNGRFFNGSIDDVKIYNTALTPAQVLQDFNTVPLSQTYYADADGDGFGNPAVSTTVNCGSPAPSGYVSDNTDCNDANGNIYPGVQPGTVSGTTTLCIGTTAIYSSTGNAGGSWSSANEDIATVDPVTGLVTAISAGTTSIIYTINNCSGTQSASQTIIINATPVVDPVSNQMVSHGSGTTAINFSGTANSYTWINDNPSIGLVASGTGNIASFTAVNTGVTAATATITVTPVNTSSGVSCTGTAISFTITVAPPAVSMNPVPNQVVCAQTLTSPVVFSSSTPGVTYSWTNSEPSISLAASGTGDIPAFLAQNNGIVPVTALITVTPAIPDGQGGFINGNPVSFSIQVNPRPQMTALNNIRVCNESSTDPIVFGGLATSFTWTNDNPGIGLAASGSGNIPAFTPNTVFTASPLVATIIVRNFTNDGITCEGSSETFTITVFPKPIMNNVANQSFCNGEVASVVFSGMAVTEYNWVSNAPLFTINSTGTGNLGPAVVSNSSNIPELYNYTVTPRYINDNFVCVGDPKSFTITVKPTPSLAPVLTQRLCEGQPTYDINFYSNVNGATFSWTNSEPSIGLAASGNGDIPSFITTGSGNAQIVARSEANGCLGAFSNFSIIVDPVPVIAPINDVTICNGNFIQNISIGSPSFTFANSNPGIGLTASGNGAGFLPSFTATNTGTSPITGTITVTAIGSGPGCFSAPVSFNITVNPSPIMDPVGTQFYCNENPTDVISFNSNLPGTVYNWTNNNTSIGLAANGSGSIPSFTPAITSIDPVDATIIVVPSYTNNGVTCSTAGRDFTITVKPLPIVDNVPDKILCNGTVSSVQFFSFNGLANYFTWTNSNPSIGIPASGTGNIDGFTAINNGTTPVVATITVTPFRNLFNNVYCEGQSKTFTITVNPTPTVNSIAQQTYCNGSTTNEIIISGDVPGTNFVWLNPNASIGLALSGNGNIPSFTAQNNLLVPNLTTITVTPQTVTGLNICIGEPIDFLIQVRPTVTPFISAGGPVTFCSNSSVTLTSDQPSGNLWSNGLTTNSISVNTSGTYTVTSTDIYGCSSLLSNPVTVTVTPYLAPAVTITATATTICGTARPTFTAALSNLTAVTYSWKKNGVLAAISSTYTPASVQHGDIITCEVSGTNECTTGSVNMVSNAIQLTVQQLANAGTINGLSTVAAGYNYPYTSNGNTGGVWASSNPSVLTIDPSTGISSTLSPGVSTITYTLLSGCGAPRLASKQVQVVEVTSPIVGSDHVCPQTSAISYSLAPTIPSGGIWSISNTSLATITVQPGTDRIISFTPVQTGTVTISYTLPGNNVLDKIVQIMNAPALGPISGPRNLCEFYGTSLTFTYTRDMVSPVIGYQWVLPGGLTLVSGQGTNTLVVRLSSTYSPTDNYQLQASALGLNCPAANESLALVSSVPQTAAPITASSNDLCAVIGTSNTISYSIPKVVGASSYLWSAQPGTTTISHPNGNGKNDTTVTIMFSNGFSTSPVTVTAVNGCGLSSQRSLTITRANPPSPGSITGPTNTCAYQLPNGITATYTVPAVSGMTYTWTIPAGVSSFTGQGTNSISFKYPNGFTSGIMNVTATNGCGTSAARSLTVSTLNPATPGVIDVIQEQACPLRIYSYSISGLPSNASSVNWQVPAGAAIMSGQGTISIRVAYPNTSVIGKVTVVAVANCRSSSVRAVAVKLPACPSGLDGKPGNQFVKGAIPENPTDTEFTAEIFPNPAVSDCQIRIRSFDKNTMATIRVLDLQGRELSRLSSLPGVVSRFGNNLKPGAYFIEVVQGANRTVQKLIRR